MRNALFYLLLLVALVAVVSCNEKSATSSEEDLLSHQVDVPELALREATPAEVEALGKERGIYLIQSSESDKNKACRWKDDPTGSTYGKVECGGRCGVVNGSDGQVGIGCFDDDGKITASGAYR